MLSSAKLLVLLLCLLHSNRWQKKHTIPIWSSSCTRVF